MQQNKLVELVRLSAAAAANYQQRFAAEDTEARKIVDIMEHFLRINARVVYGGAAINAHLPASKKFYDPSLYLPDYDFMTPDPLQDCADLITSFQAEGFTDVEAKFGIHEGTYKIFVNYRPAADITYMPPDIYERLITDADVIDGIHYASVNYLRMNAYLELSRPAGMVGRWEKVYERLLLLNEEFPLKAGNCSLGLGQGQEQGQDQQNEVVAAGIESKAVFLSGLAYLVNKTPDSDEVVLMMSDHVNDIVDTLAHLKPTRYEAIGELLPARVELRSGRRHLVAVIFETVACHSYTEGLGPKGYRLGSLDLLIQMYYALYFANITNYASGRLLCLIHALIELESSKRVALITKGKKKKASAFARACIGHQPQQPELKRAHRARVKEKRKELMDVLHIQNSPRLSRRRK